MCCYKLTFTLLLVTFVASYVFGIEINSRQKRCIVVQKQSGTHGDSTEDGVGDDDRSAEPRRFKPHRRRVLSPLDKIRHDEDNVPVPNLLKYQTVPIGDRFPGDLRRYKNRFYRTH